MQLDYTFERQLELEREAASRRAGKAHGSNECFHG